MKNIIYILLLVIIILIIVPSSSSLSSTTAKPTSLAKDLIIFEEYRSDVFSKTCTRVQGEYDLDTILYNINELYTIFNNGTKNEEEQENNDNPTAAALSPQESGQASESLFLEMEMHKKANNSILDVVEHERRLAYQKYLAKTVQVTNELYKFLNIILINTPYNTTETFLNNAKISHVLKNIENVLKRVSRFVQTQAYGERNKKIMYRSETDHGSLLLCRSFVNSVNILENVADGLEKIVICLNDHEEEVNAVGTYKRIRTFSCNAGPVLVNYIYGYLKLNPLTRDQVKRLKERNKLIQLQGVQYQNAMRIQAMIRRQRMAMLMRQLIMKRKILSIVEEVKRIRQNTTMDEEQLDLYLQEQDGLTVNGTRLVKAILFEQETNNKRVIMYMRQVMMKRKILSIVEEVKRIQKNTKMDEKQLDHYLEEKQGLTVNGTKLVKAILAEEEAKGSKNEKNTVTKKSKQKSGKRNRKLLSSSMKSRSKKQEKSEKAEAMSGVLQKKSQIQMKSMQNMMSAKNTNNKKKEKEIESVNDPYKEAIQSVDNKGSSLRRTQTLESIAQEVKKLMVENPDSTDEEIVNYLRSEKGLNNAEIDAVSKRLQYLEAKVKEEEKLKLRPVPKPDARLLHCASAKCETRKCKPGYKLTKDPKGGCCRICTKNKKAKSVKKLIIDDIDHSKLLSNADKKNIHRLEEEEDAKVDNELKSRCTFHEKSEPYLCGTPFSVNLENALTVFQLPLHRLNIKNFDPMFFSYEIIDHCGSLEKLLTITLKDANKKNKTVIEGVLDCASSHLNVITCEHFACKSDFDNTLGMSKMINAEIVIKNKADTIGIIGVRSKGATFDIEILEKEGAHDEWKFNELKDKRKWLKESRMC
jgi:hypothetical protein